MADNIALTPGTGPETGAADDIAGVLHPRVKISLGPDGTANDAIAGAGAVGVGVQRVTLASDDPAVAKLTTIDVDTSALAGAVSGAEVQVDVVGALPAGNNNIGDVDIASIAAGTNNIGDVDIASIAAGDNNIGNVDIASIAAGDNNIGNVDVVSSIPGTGATNLGKAVDSVAGATDTGVAVLGVRDDALTTLTPVDGDYAPLRVDSTGALHVTGGGGGTQYTEGDTDATITGTAMLVEGAANTLVVAPGTAADGLLVNLGANNDTIVTGTVTANAGTNLNTSALALETGGNLADVKTSVQLIDDVVFAEDVAATAADKGVAVLAVRRDADTSLVGTDNDYSQLQVDANGRLKVEIFDGGDSLTVDGTVSITSLPAGTSNIGDVDVLSVVPGTGATALGKAVDSAGGATDTGVAVLALRDDALTTLTPVDGDYTNLRVSSTGALHVTGGGGGTEYVEDEAAAADPTGNMLIAVRRDTLTVSEVSADGDNVALKASSKGQLHVALADALPAGTANIGDVDIASIAAGDNNIGNVDILSIAAGDNNIGNVDIVSAIPGTGATNLGKAVDSASGGTDTGVAVLAVRDDALSTLTPVEGDYTNLRVDSTGALHVTGGGGGVQYTEGATDATITGTALLFEGAADTLVAAPGTAADGLLVNLGANNDVTVSGVSTAANQSTIIGHLDGVEGLLTTIDADTGSILTSVQTLDDAIFTDDAAYTPATSKLLVIGAEADETTPDAVDEGDAGALRMTLQRALHTNIRTAAGAEVSFTDPVDVNPISGQTGVAGGAGAVGATVQRVTLASDDPAVASLSVLDDWDETNRAAVNLIAGQVAITAGAGAVAANTPRVTHASDDPVTTAVQLIDNAIVADDAAFTPATTAVMMAGFEFDDTSPDSVNEGDAGAGRMSANRNQYVTLRDGAGNERGMNIDASGNANVILAASTGTQEVVGDVAQDAAVGGNPILIGGRASTATPTAMSADGDSVFQWLDRSGAAIVVGNIVDDGAFTPGTSRVVAIGAFADETSPDAVDEGDLGAVRMTLQRGLHVNLRDSSGNEIISGTQVTLTNTVTRAANTTTYAVFDNFGSTDSGGYTMTGAARVSGGSGYITGIDITFDEDAATPLTGYIAIFDSSFTQVADNTAFVVSDAEARTRITLVPFSLADFGNNGAVALEGQNIGFTTVGSANLRFAVITSNAYVPTTNSSVMTIRFKILQTT